MTTLVFFIEQTAIGLYILVGAGILWYVYKWMNASESFRSGVFELERDLARYRRANAITAIILLIEVGLFISGVQRVVAPTVREDRQMQDLLAVGPVLDGDFATPTPPAVVEPLSIDASGIDLGPQDEAGIFITPTLTPTPVGTILPDVDPPIGCDTPNAQLQIPANGMRIFQPIEVRGTAFMDNFSSYKLEIGRPDPDGSFVFAPFDVSGVPVNEMGLLSQFNPAPYQSQPGFYQIRLMVFDINDQLGPSCLVNVEITTPIPTPTPLGG